jgi:signal transduction histidine kinase
MAGDGDRNDSGRGDDMVADRLRLLLDASELLGGSLDYESTIHALARFLVPRFADGCAIDVVEPSGKVRRAALIIDDEAKAPLAAELMEIGPPDPAAPNGILAILERGAAMLVPEFTDEGLERGARDARHLALLRALDMKAGMIVPLSGPSGPLGVLWLFTLGSNRRFDETDLALARDLARRAALAIENARLYRDAREAILARDTFLSVASHELKTPLTALQLQVQSIARLLEDPQVDVPRMALVTKIATAERQLKRLHRLINDLLDVSRISSGRLELRLERVDLAAMTRAVVARLEPALSDAGCSVAIDARVSVLGRWDRLRLEQVLTNLLANAAKYGAGKPIEICVSATPTTALVSVADSGIGIACEDHRRIFRRFERAASDRHYGGLGMGLWIAHQIVEAHAGTIEVESEIGRGAKFTVALPVARAASRGQGQAGRG